MRSSHARISKSLSPCWARIRILIDSDVDTATLKSLLCAMFGLKLRCLTRLLHCISQEKVIGGMKRRVKGGHLHETVEDVARHMG
jgi:hypothetical protein